MEGPNIEQPIGAIDPPPAAASSTFAAMRHRNFQIPFAFTTLVPFSLALVFGLGTGFMGSSQRPTCCCKPV